MHIGQLARRVGVSPDTIRYYEKEGVLPTPARLRSQYRSYGDADVARLQFILKAKALGFTLRDISELLRLSGDMKADMAQVRQAAQARLAGVEERLAELSRLRDGLKALVAECPGQGSLSTCPIVAALTEKTT